MWNRECSFPENDKNNCESNRVSNIRISCFHYNLKVTAEWSPAIKVSIIIKTKPAGGHWGENIYKYNNKSIIAIIIIIIIMSGQTDSSSTIQLNSIGPGVYCRINEAFIIDFGRNHIFIFSGKFIFNNSKFQKGSFLILLYYKHILKRSFFSEWTKREWIFVTCVWSVRSICFNSMFNGTEIFFSSATQQESISSQLRFLSSMWL